MMHGQKNIKMLVCSVGDLATFGVVRIAT